MTVPTREQVRALLDEKLDYRAVGQRLGIPACLAYMIATGRPADGGDTPSQREIEAGGLLASSQHLANPPHENPTVSKAVQEWIRARVAADTPAPETADHKGKANDKGKANHTGKRASRSGKPAGRAERDNPDVGA
jgi:hypothetical protein